MTDHFQQTYQKKTTVRKTLLLVLVLLTVVAQWGLFSTPGLGLQAETIAINRTGFVSVYTSANVRSEPRLDDPATPAIDEDAPIIDNLKNRHPVTVLSSTTGSYFNYYGDLWYNISFTSLDGTSKTGYVVAAFVTLDPDPNATPTPTLSPTPTPLPTPTPAADPDFEALLTTQGFPESYKPNLRLLHTLYPNWQFLARQTGLDWTTVIEEEDTPGYSLISGNLVNDSWKSLEPEAYNWTTNLWKPYDGQTWVMCNKDVIAYYMDPRNFMDITRIFQFEALNYQDGIHTAAGIQGIFGSGFMATKMVTYLDEATQQQVTSSYADVFMKAGQISGVSPYHLASRSKVEVGGESASVTGLFSVALKAAYDKARITYDTITTEYDGYYNFFNIGASSSTEILGNVRNGLEYAKYGSDRKPEQTATDTDRLIPWNNQYRSIIGGAKIIGASYINVGQNTIYLQKFDVDNSDGKLYWHQYMGNIQAPYYESASISKAYIDSGLINSTMVFIFPVYNNMPETSVPRPAATGNPNNWLKSLSISSFSLTPTFNPAVVNSYSLIVDNTVTKVSVNASPVSSKSAITGSGMIQLAVGENVVNINVKAENGNIRTYTVTIVRKTVTAAPTPTVTPTDGAPGATGVPSATPDPTVSPTMSPSPSPTPTPSPSPTPTPSPSPTPTPSPIPTPTPVPEAALASSIYKISGSVITGIDPLEGKNTISAFMANLTYTSGYTCQLLKPDGTTNDNLVGTASQLNLLIGNVVMKSYTVILYGDSNGDGRINSADLNSMFENVLGRKELTGNLLLAVDVDHNGKINSADLNVAFNHVLGKSSIVQ